MKLDIQIKYCTTVIHNLVLVILMTFVVSCNTKNLMEENCHNSELCKALIEGYVSLGKEKKLIIVPNGNDVTEYFSHLINADSSCMDNMNLLKGAGFVTATENNLCSKDVISFWKDIRQSGFIMGTVTINMYVSSVRNDRAVKKISVRLFTNVW